MNELIDWLLYHQDVVVAFNIDFYIRQVIEVRMAMKDNRTHGEVRHISIDDLRRQEVFFPLLNDMHDKIRIKEASLSISKYIQEDETIINQLLNDIYDKLKKEEPNVQQNNEMDS